jgi:hypothetical protein
MLLNRALRMLTLFVLAVFAVPACGLNIAWAQSGALAYGTDAVSAPPTVTLPTGNNYYYWNGNSTTHGTQVNDYWLNKVGGELSAAIQGCGLTISMATLNQLSTCLQGQHGRMLDVQVFTASGTYTPASGTTRAEVEVLGGGGGGGGASATSSSQLSVGAGGGAGSYAKVIVASPGSVTVTIGAGGAGGSAGASGSGGSITSFGGLVSCPGGGGGGSGTVATGASGQIGIGASGAGCAVAGPSAEITSWGAPGENGFYFGNNVSSGSGAPSVMGGGSGNTNMGNGGTTGSPGAGGSGAGCPASCAGHTGGAGTQGIVIIHEYS